MFLSICLNIQNTAKISFSTCIYTYICMMSTDYIYTCIHIYIDIYLHIYMCTCVHMCVQVSVFVHVHLQTFRGESQSRTDHPGGLVLLWSSI